MDRYTWILDHLRADDFRRLRSFSGDGRSKFSTWLVVVARRLCVDHHRQRYGRDRGSGNDVERRRLADLCAEQLDAGEIPDSAAETPDRLLLAAETREALDGALEALDPRDRLLLRLRFEDDLPANEIAALLKLPTPFHVYRRVNTLLGALRRSLEARGVESSVR